MFNFVISMRKFLFFGLCLFSFATYAQDSSRTSAEEVNILYRNEAAGGLVLHSNGFGITFKRGWHLTGNKKQMLDIDFVSLRDPKQYKLANPNFPDAKPYFFGKLNFAYILRGGYGRQNIIFGKGERSGVEVRYNYFGGLSLGLTKPVYLDILVKNPYEPSSMIIDTRRYDPNDPDQQDQDQNIYGPGPYFMGIDMMSIYPGIYGKFSNKITALEAGVVVDAYAKKIPIMANEQNHNLFFNFYISLIWGGKW
jgi:hypothetical protein